jgi:hypothetical protein
MKGVPHILEKKFIHARALTIRKIRKFVEKELKEFNSSGQLPPWKVTAKKREN